MLEKRPSSQQSQRQKLKQKHPGVLDSKPWISESQHQQGHGQSSSSSSFSPPRPPPPAGWGPPNDPGNGGNVDRVLFNNLVEMVPLVETLMDRRANSSFTRRASMIYTPAPPQKKKSVEPKSRKAIQTASTKKKKESEDNISDKHTAADNQDNGPDGFSIFSSRSLAAEKDSEELNVLRGQVDELQNKLLEKDESLKSAESSLLSAHVTHDELKHQIVEKDSLLKSAQSQLNNTKIKLADKQAALEKLEWESREASGKAEKLQCNLATVDFEIAAFMQCFKELSKDYSVAEPEENITCFDRFDLLPNIDVDETAIEEARLAYDATLAFAKDNPGEEALALASEARIKLLSFVV